MKETIDPKVIPVYQVYSSFPIIEFIENHYDYFSAYIQTSCKDL